MGDNDTMKKGLQMKEKSASVGEMEKSGENEIAIASEELVGSIRPLIEQAKARVAQSVNSELVILYWQIGKRISDDLPAESRAEYGAKVVELVSKRLAAEYGKGFRRSNVFHMIRFAEVFDDIKIVQTLSGQLSWYGLQLHRPAEAYDHRRQGLLPRPALLSPQPASYDGHRAEAGQLRCCLQGPDGALSALAGQIRASAG